MYKYANKEKTTVLKDNKTFIFRGGNGWNRFLQWKEEGNITEPFETEEEAKQKLIKTKNEELDFHYTDIFNQHILSDSKKLILLFFKALHLVRKEIKGKATTTDVAFLDHMNKKMNDVKKVKSEYLKKINWLNNSNRTFEEINNFDVKKGL